MQSIGALTSTSNSLAIGVNANGSVIVGESNNQAFRWTSSGMVGLGYLSGASTSWALATSAAGDVVIGHSGKSAFRWTASAGMQALQGLPGLSSDQYFANALTADGSFVVGQNGPRFTAMIWDAAGQPAMLADYLRARGVSMLGWSALEDATGISADGRFITGRGIYEGQNRAFIADIGVIPAPGAASILALASWAVRGRRRG
jgi:probable HAF family extracellular repeat protein